MSGYRLNTPYIAGKETKWYMLLSAMYHYNIPLHKKEWLERAGIHFTDEVKVCKYHEECWTRYHYSHRHWRGLYPDLFREFRERELVSYNHKTKKWEMNRDNYIRFCKELKIDP